MASRELSLSYSPSNRAKVKTYLQLVLGAVPDDAMVDRFLGNIHVLDRLFREITFAEKSKLIEMETAYHSIVEGGEHTQRAS
ncbi:hypothetical protein [Microbulbifer epialgicus]|uniref:Uncharacterized protein n=1 Tax=Microbulbifer epialgicus TaxID=393907 RepID=A0ABV4NTW6_9GAMM